jgi:transposase
MDIIYKNVCGLDVHKKLIVACVLKVVERGEIKKEIRKYGTMTRDILALSDWLKQEEVTHVAMESTGVYWKPIWNILEGEFEVILVNARHIKQVPGRKTDMKDSEWIGQLLQHGLLPKSFVPVREQRELRDLTRHRTKSVQQRVSIVNRIQKVVEDANIKLSSVVTDILGVSGRAMIEEMITGEEDSDRLAEVAQRKLRGKIPELRIALEGRVTDHHRFMLKLLMKQLHEIEALIDEISMRIEEHFRPFEDKVFSITEIPGVKQQAVENIIAEIGINMEQFPTEAHISSWAGICPGNNESAGKHKTGKTTRGSVWLRRALVQAAWAAIRTKNTYFSEQYKRIAARRGKNRALIAVAHTILVIIYHMLKENKPYYELGSEYFIRLKPERHKKYHIKKLEALGYKVILEETMNDAA